MNPLLPDFTIHDFIKKPESATEPKTFTKEELRQLYPDKPSEDPISTSIVDAITGEKWNMVPVINSSNILEIGFKEGKCRIQFKGLVTWEYEPISEELWLKFISANSKGQFFGQYIRNNKKIKASRIL